MRKESVVFMNNMFPFMNNMPIPNNAPMPIPRELVEEINKLKNEVDLLKERIKRLENNKKNTFLQKDDGFYMM